MRLRGNRDGESPQPSEAPRAEADASSHLPRWFFGLAGASLAVALLLPFRPVKYLLAAVLAGALLSFFSSGPHRVLLAFLLAMPILDLLPPDMIPIPGLNTETLAILGLAYAAYTTSREAPAARNATSRAMTFLLVVLTIGALISAVEGVRAWEGVWIPLTPWEIFASLKNRIFYMFLIPISFVLLFTPGRVRAALHMIAWCTILVSLQAIGDVRSLLSSGLTLETNRAPGLVGNQPNLFGGFLAMMIAVYTPLFLSKGASFREKILFGSVMGFGGAALLFTLSRGSWMALAVGCMVIALFRGARLILFLLVVVWSSQWWLPEQVVNRVRVTTDSETKQDEDQLLDDSAQVRLDQWVTLPTMVGDAPFLGHGFRSFPEVWFRYGPTHRPKAAHSTYVELGAENGVFGLAGYVWFVGTLLMAGWRLARRSRVPFLSDLGVGFAAACVCLMVLDTSGTRFREGEVMAFLWVLGGAVNRLIVTEEIVPSARGRSGAGARRRGPLSPRRGRPPNVPSPAPATSP